MTATRTPPKKSAPAGNTTRSPLSSVPRVSTPEQVRTPPKSPKERRVEGVRGIFQLIAGALYFVPAYRADAAAVIMHAGPIAEEAANIADTDEKAAALLDRITSVGPYGALMTAVGSLGLQIAANHGIVKPGFMGTNTPDELMSIVLGEESDVGSARAEGTGTGASA